MTSAPTPCSMQKSWGARPRRFVKFVGSLRRPRLHERVSADGVGELSHDPALSAMRRLCESLGLPRGWVTQP